MPTMRALEETHANNSVAHTITATLEDLKQAKSGATVHLAKATESHLRDYLATEFSGREFETFRQLKGRNTGLHASIIRLLAQARGIRTVHNTPHGLNDDVLRRLRKNPVRGEIDAAIRNCDRPEFHRRPQIAEARHMLAETRRELEQAKLADPDGRLHAAEVVTGDALLRLHPELYARILTAPGTYHARLPPSPAGRTTPQYKPG